MDQEEVSQGHHPFKKSLATTIRSRADASMDSNTVLNEFVSIGIINKNADHAHARQRALTQAPSTLALKSRAIANEEDDDDDERDEQEVDDVRGLGRTGKAARESSTKMR